MTGARAVRDHVLDRDADVDLHVVWGRVLPSDDRLAAARSAEVLKGERVRHYWDPEMIVGQRLGEHLSLFGADFAWDVYLLYGPGAVWSDEPPDPTTWAHQMNGVETEHFRTGDELLRFLEVAVRAPSAGP